MKLENTEQLQYRYINFWLEPYGKGWRCFNYMDSRRLTRTQTHSSKKRAVQAMHKLIDNEWGGK